MFIGHYALALGAKRLTPRTSLATLIFGAQWLDLLWPILLLLGAERVAIRPGITRLTPLDFESYPYSHSLVAVLGWAVAIGGAYFAFRRDGRAAVVLGALVASHWFLDLLVHRPDLPVTISGTSRLGLGLWNHPAVEVTLESLMFIAGAWIYLRSTKAKDRQGTLAIAALLALLALIHVANVFGPPPPSVPSVAWSCLLLWLFLPFAAWADRHRTARRSASLAHRA